MSAKDDRHPIEPADWLVEWDRNLRRVIEAFTTEAVTPWFVGTTKPARPGWYDRMFTDGLWRMWWSGLAWHAGKGGPPHWRQVGDYPCWRGLLAPAADREAEAFHAYMQTVKPPRRTLRGVFDAGIAYGRKNPQ